MKATPPVRPQDVSTHRLAPRSLHISRCRRLQEQEQQEQQEDHLARCRRMREQEEQEDHRLARCRRMQEQQQEQREEEEEEEEALRRGDMNDCYSRLKRLVPTIPQDKKVSKVEILQHVIDYILDLQLALETHPALSKQTPQTQTQTQTPQTQTQQTLRTPGPPNPSRTPLTVLNTDHQRTSIVKKPEDSILCR